MSDHAPTFGYSLTQSADLLLIDERATWSAGKGVQTCSYRWLYLDMPPSWPNPPDIDEVETP